MLLIKCVYDGSFAYIPKCIMYRYIYIKNNYKLDFI